MIVRGYSQKDFSEIVDINDQCFFGSERPSGDELRAMLSISDLWVARKDSTIMGFAIVTGENVKQPGVYLWHFGVRPAFHGRGLGSEILRELHAHYKATGSPAISLHVNANNPAQKMYFNHGYRVTGTDPGYYINADGIKMTKLFA